MAGLIENDGAEDSEPISAINVTPFVDVVLVLLVIFMVTAPMILKDVINVKLPKAASGDGQPQTQTLSFVIMRNGNVLMNGELVSQDEVTSQVKDALKENPDVQAIIGADEETQHKNVVTLIDWIKSAGLSKFAMQIEKKTDDP